MDYKELIPQLQSMVRLIDMAKKENHEGLKAYDVSMAALEAKFAIEMLIKEIQKYPDKYKESL